MTPESRRIAVTGADGMVGRAVREVASARGLPLTRLTRTDLDVTSPRDVRARFEDLRPEVVLHLAAYTAVDAAEDDLDRAMAVNRDGSANVAAAAQAVGARVVFVSTDYVFDGRASRPYDPDDPTDPVNAYGRTKWLAEQEIRSATQSHAIVRTSWVFAPWGKNFVRTIAAKAAVEGELRVVNDQRGRPTSATDLAIALLHLALESSVTGTLHFANAGETTWHDFAGETIRLVSAQGRPVLARLSAVETKDFPTRARRPRYSVLDTTAWVERTGIVPRDWRAALADTVAALE